MTCNAWPIVWPCADKPAKSTELHEAAAQQAAQSLLWARTGRNLGLCRLTESYRIGRTGCYLPMPDGGEVVLGTWHRDHHHGVLFLEQSPVQLVHSVTVDGVVLDSSGWRLTGQRLERIAARWGTEVVVDYTHGVPLEGELWGSAALAMGEVAYEYLQAFCGGPCKLPSRATSITRQGVTVTLGAPLPAPAAGRGPMLLGLPLADAFISALNPAGLTSRSQVYSPDVPTARRERVSLPAATNVHGVSTVILEDGYEGDPWSLDVTFPDAVFLSGGVGSVSAQIRTPTDDPVATLTPTISGATLTLTVTAAPAPGDYVLDVSVAGVTYVQRTGWHVNAQVST